MKRPLLLLGLCFIIGALNAQEAFKAPELTDAAKWRGYSGQGGSAFSGMDRGGSEARDYSNRGSSSRQSMSSGSGSGGGRGGGRR